MTQVTVSLAAPGQLAHNKLRKVFEVINSQTCDVSLKIRWFFATIQP